MSSKYRHLYQFCYVKIFGTSQYYGNLVLLDDPGRVRSQITNVEGQIQRFDFDCNLDYTAVDLYTSASIKAGYCKCIYSFFRFEAPYTWYIGWNRLEWTYTVF